MAVSLTPNGSFSASDIQALIIRRTDAGELLATVTYKVTLGAVEMSRSASWTLSSGEKTTLSALLPSAASAAGADVGL